MIAVRLVLVHVALNRVDGIVGIRLVAVHVVLDSLDGPIHDVVGVHQARGSKLMWLAEAFAV